MSNETENQGAPVVISRADAKAQGLKRYFTGIPCTKGHVAERFVSSPACVVCARERAARRYNENPEKYREAGRVSRAVHAEEIRQKARQKYAADLEAGRKKSRAWKLANPDAARLSAAKTRSSRKEKERIQRLKREAENPGIIRQASACYRAANKEKVLLATRKWVSENPGKANALTAKRRALKKMATPAWADAGAIREIYIRAAEVGKHVDHIIPLQHRLVCGLHVENNLQALDVLENQKKHNTFDPSEHEWRLAP